MRKWLLEEKEYYATCSHYAAAKRELEGYISRGWDHDSILSLDGYSGHMFAGIRIKGERITVEIRNRGTESFSVPRLLSLLEKEKYQQPLFVLN